MASASVHRLKTNLLALRARHELTQERVAELAGVDYKFYQSIEAQRRANVTLETLDRIAAVYGLAGADLIGAAMPDTKGASFPAPRERRRPPRKSSS